MDKLLFLDFDGVLHPNFRPLPGCFSRVDVLMEALHGNSANLSVVISSSWRFHYSFDEILAYLPEALGVLVCGATPEVEPGRHQRYREIRAYVDQVKTMTDWRALDDDVFGFPNDCRQLIRCDGNFGIDSNAALSLKTWLTELDCGRTAIVRKYHRLASEQ
jgi:hypothetical protein